MQKQKHKQKAKAEAGDEKKAGKAKPDAMKVDGAKSAADVSVCFGTLSILSRLLLSLLSVSQIFPVFISAGKSVKSVSNVTIKYRVLYDSVTHAPFPSISSYVHVFSTSNQRKLEPC